MGASNTLTHPCEEPFLAPGTPFPQDSVCPTLFWNKQSGLLRSGSSFFFCLSPLLKHFHTNIFSLSLSLSGFHVCLLFRERIDLILKANKNLWRKVACLSAGSSLICYYLGSPISKVNSGSQLTRTSPTAWIQNLAYIAPARTSFINSCHKDSDCTVPALFALEAHCALWPVFFLFRSATSIELVSQGGKFFFLGGEIAANNSECPCALLL